MNLPDCTWERGTAYSPELRSRCVLSLLELPNVSIKEVATQYKVSPFFVAKMAAQWDESEGISSLHRFFRQNYSRKKSHITGHLLKVIVKKNLKQL